MDKLDEKLVHSITKFGQTWTFRRPTARQMVAADVLAAQMRLNTPVASLLYGANFSDMIASLNTYVVEPRGYDFGELYDDQIGEIYTEVAEWLNSFRQRVAEGEGKLG